MLDLPEFIISVYCQVDESLKRVGPLRSRGFAPVLTDSEVITMEIVGEFLGIETDKGIWEYFRRHWRPWFPCMPSRTTFVRQATNLWAVKRRFQEELALSLGAGQERFHVIDAFPVKACGFKRSGRSRVFRGEAAYGYCASKKEYFYGFLGHLVVTPSGVVTSISLTAANLTETRGVWDVTDPVKGLLVGDKAYLGGLLKKELDQRGVRLETPLRSNMRDDRDPTFVRWLIRVRKIIESVIAQLSQRFGIERTRARDRWHLTNRIVRKCLAHTLAIWLNVSMGRKPLRMEGLLAA